MLARETNLNSNVAYRRRCSHKLLDAPNGGRTQQGKTLESNPFSFGRFERTYIHRRLSRKCGIDWKFPNLKGPIFPVNDSVALGIHDFVVAITVFATEAVSKRI